MNILGSHSIKRWLLPGAILLAVAILSLYALADPAQNPFPRCVFWQLTGLRCPGCGSQRALHALLNGDLAAAWHFNAMFVLSLPLLAALALLWLMRHRLPGLYRGIHAPAVPYTSLALLLAWWIGRNLAGI